LRYFRKNQVSWIIPISAPKVFGTFHFIFPNSFLKLPQLCVILFASEPIAKPLVLQFNEVAKLHPRETESSAAYCILIFTLVKLDAVEQRVQM
jgi:hypothetical protein